MKNWSTRILILVLLIVAVLSGYNYFHRPFLSRFTQQQPATEDQEIDSVAVRLAEMSIEERVAQMISLPVVLGAEAAGAATESAVVEQDLAWIAANQPGFVTLFGSALAAEQVADFSQQLGELPLTYKPLVAVDHEGGTVQRLSGGGFTRLPNWRQVCGMLEESRQELLASSAAELSEAGVQLAFAPVVDVARPGAYLGNRACQDSEIVVAAASDYITSFAQFGVLPVIKHFPGIGSLTTDPHFQLDAVNLESQDTTVFEQLLTSFPNIGVMTTHVVVEGRTDELPCSLSASCLGRFPVSFPEAMVFTDALEMAAASEADGDEELALTEIAVRAVLAGNNVLVFGDQVDLATIDEIIGALAVEYQLDENFRSVVDNSVSKILSVKVPSEQ